MTSAVTFWYTSFTFVGKGYQNTFILKNYHKGIVIDLCLLEGKLSQVVYIDQITDLETGYL